MAHIACSSKNSFALNDNGTLYSWGSYETGLLGSLEENDVIVPTEIKVQNGFDNYSVESVNAGQFHVGIIANRNDIFKFSSLSFEKDQDLQDAKKEVFDVIRKWFKEHLKINSSGDLYKLMTRTEMNKTEIQPEDFKKYLLKPFLVYLQMNHRDFFEMEQSYCKSLLPEQSNNENKAIKLETLETLNKRPEANIKELIKFTNKFKQYFSENDDDFKFKLFAQFVFQFQPYIIKEDIIRLFEYSDDLRKDNKIQNSKCLNNLIKKLNVKEQVLKILSNNKHNLPKKYEDFVKQDYVIESNVLIDYILGKNTGMKNLFTWGIHTEGRLGYKEVDEPNTTSNNNNNDNTGYDEVQIQRIPKIVYFKQPTKVISVSCGFYHTLALSIEKEVYAWGTSKYGCLGKYLQNNQETPEKIETAHDNEEFKNIKQICAGMYMSLALDENGRVFSWGLGNNGRLGHGDENSVEKPKKIEYFITNNIKINKISCGDLHCAAISNIKALYTWGNGNYGKLGHCNFEHVFSPSRVGFFSMSKVDNVICGSYNTIAVTTDSKVFAWGKNSHGMLGIPHLQEQNVLVPSEIFYQKDEPSLIVSEIALGSMHQLFLCNSGDLFSCGNSINGILGIEKVYDKLVFPTKIKGITFHTLKQQNIKLYDGYAQDFSLKTEITNVPTAIKFVDCSSYNTAFITNTGELYMSGRKALIPQEKEKQIDDIQKDFELAKDPYISKVSFFRAKVHYVSLGKEHAICIADGKAYSWGKNSYGMCGLSGKGINDEIETPTLIEGIQTSIKMSCVSDTHSLVLTTNGEIYAFGSNMYGKLGIGDLNKYFTIGAIPMEPEPILVTNVTYAHYIACSNFHSACIMKYDSNLKESYSVYTWGNGFNGKLGHSGISDSYEPKMVEFSDKANEKNGSKRFVKLALGDEFSLALDEKNNLWGWGKKKYIPGYNNDPNSKGKLENPVKITNNKKQKHEPNDMSNKIGNNDDDQFQFKFIAAKYNCGFAVNVNGKIFSWGDTIVEEAEVKIEDKIGETMNFVAIGFNHFASIDAHYSPYAWGNNLYSKCGFSSVVDNEEKVQQQYFEKPKRIEVFHQQFNEFLMNASDNYSIDEDENEIDDNDKPRKNAIRGKNPNQKDNKDKEHTQDREEKDEIQKRLLDEPVANKNLGLMVKDIKLNDQFFSTMRAFFKQLQALENTKTKLFIDTEDKMISIMNRSGCKSNKKFDSEVPIILAKNMTYFETFMELIQIHPCYLKKVHDLNNSTFMELLKMIYGRNDILLKNKRTMYNLLGLWNSIFHSESNDYENSNPVLYDIYELLFEISDENINIAYQIISLIVLSIISETYADVKKNQDKADDPDQILKYYKDKFKSGNETKKLVFEYLSTLFAETKEEHASYSYSVLWILSRFVNQFKKPKSSDPDDKGIDENLYRRLHMFIFQPCQKIINNIGENKHNETGPSQELQKVIIQTLYKSSNKNTFTELLNEYKNDKDNFDKMLTKLPKSEMLKEIYEILDTFKIVEQNNHITNLDKSLQKYQFDFSLKVVKEMCQLLSVNGNEKVTIPISIKDLIELQRHFEKIQDKLPEKDPLKYLLNEIKDFSLQQLESTSTINQTILNLTIKPFKFYFKFDNDMIKCDKCLLPIPSSFLEEEQKEMCLNGNKWSCQECGSKYTGKDIECKICNTIKTQEDIKCKSLFFKRYYIKEHNKLVLKLEEVLYILPQLYKNDDILKEINIQKNKFIESKDRKHNEKNNELYKEFSSLLNDSKENNEFSTNEKEIMKYLKQKILINIQQREKHTTYIKKIEETIIYIQQLMETAKVNHSFYEKKMLIVNDNVSKGYVTQFFNQFNRLLKSEKDKNKEKKKVASKVYLVKDLIENNVIQSIKFNDKQDQSKLIQKSYLEIGKHDDGFILKLRFKENYRNLVVCGNVKRSYNIKEILINSEEVLDLRRNARYNSVIGFGNINFNTFYLVRLLNSLLSE